MARGRLHKRFGKRRRKYADNPAPRSRSNPPLLTDVAELLGPGFAAFVATRFLTRIAAVQVEKWKPSWGKHAGAVASIGSFLAAWFLAHRVKWLEKYHTPLVVGSGIATGQSIMQLYLPRVGWIVSDATPELNDVASGTGSLSPATQMDVLTQNGFSPTNEDPNDFQYNDSYDAGIFARDQQQHHHHRQQAPAAQAPSSSTDDDDLSDLDIQADASMGGIFAGGVAG